jgi:outer membrane protein TolC
MFFVRLLAASSVFFTLLAGRLAQAQSESGLSERVSRAQLEQLALARHPALAAATARVQAERSTAGVKGGLEAPQLFYQQWAVPLKRPYDLSQASMLMLGARVKVPSRAVRDAERNAARARVAELDAEHGLTKLQVLSEVRQAYAEYTRATREEALHASHAELMEHLYDLTETAYASGRASQRELHDARISVARLHTDIAMVEASRERARVRLNLLTGRPADAPLGTPQEEAQAQAPFELARLERALGDHPALRALEKVVQGQARVLEARKVAARRPEWMVGADYMAEPRDNAWAGYGLMVSMSLPWLSSTLAAEEARAQHQLVAEKSALAAERQRVSIDLHTSLIELKAAEQTRALIQSDWLLHAQEAYQSAQASWSSGQGEARELVERASELLEARAALVRAELERELRLIDIERSSGVDLHVSAEGDAP